MLAAGTGLNVGFGPFCGIWTLCGWYLLAVLSPLVLSSNLLLFLGGKVVCDVEGFANLLRRLALDHVGDGLAAHVEERLDIEIVGCLY